jgi:hypothetical protein
MRREMADVLETVKRAKNRDKGCTLLIGAGCSVKGGIPTANEFVEIIRKEYPRAYDRAPKKTYPHLMAELLVAERHDLISQYINNAKLNWAYLAIAQLLKNGFVDRILTVNFDPLVMRACALVGIFPAVYDFAASQSFNPDFIARQSVFYLHGQHTGFVVLNTESEVERLSQHLGPVFTDSGRGRVWIVAGYSGENDPVFDHLAKIGRYDNGLYWICYKDNPPQTHVQDGLLVDGKYCFNVQGYDADDFFVELAQGLGCFPPTFVQTPFTHLETLLEPVLPYSKPGNNLSLEAIPKKLLQDAIEKIEKPGSLVLRARDMLMAGNFNSVIEMESELTKAPTAELTDLIAWGYVSAGIALGREAETKTGEEADQRWKLAGEKYEAALKIQPNHADAFYNWGVALVAQALTKSGEEAEHLFGLAAEKYEAAVKINPTDYDALNNWAGILKGQAREKSGKKADQLWASTFEKYDAALKLKPDFHMALFNWANGLDEQARKKSGKEADRLWALAGKKYEATLKVAPDMDGAFYNWGDMLAAQAATKKEDEARRLLVLAGEKYEAALKIKPDIYEALYSWGGVLDDLARTKSGEEADRLWMLAFEKYDAALKVKPDHFEALNNWAVALYAQGIMKGGEEADRLWALAGEKCEAALKIKPDYHRALYNWGLALTAQSKLKGKEEGKILLDLAYHKLAAARALAPELYPAKDEPPAVKRRKRTVIRRKKTKPRTKKRALSR